VEGKMSMNKQKPTPRLEELNKELENLGLVLEERSTHFVDRLILLSGATIPVVLTVISGTIKLETDINQYKSLVSG